MLCYYKLISQCNVGKEELQCTLGKARYVKPAIIGPRRVKVFAPLTKGPADSFTVANLGKQAA